MLSDPHSPASSLHFPGSPTPALPVSGEAQAPADWISGERQGSAGTGVRVRSVTKVKVHRVTGVRLLKDQGQRSSGAEIWLMPLFSAHRCTPHMCHLEELLVE